MLGFDSPGGRKFLSLRRVASVPRAINGISKKLGGYSLCKSDRKLLQNMSGVRRVCGNACKTLKAVFHPDQFDCVVCNIIEKHSRRLFSDIITNNIMACRQMEPEIAEHVHV